MEGKVVYAVLLAVLILVIFLLSWIFRRTRRSAAASASPSRADAASLGLLVSCPLCGTPLRKGENLVTKVYRPMTVSDQLCTINGCPHCFPEPEPGVKRTCPVCRRDVPLSAHLTARLFNKTDGKKHVVVTGCTGCIAREKP